MSITVIDLITDTLQEINVIDANEAPSPEQGQKTLRRLNQMLAEWERDGIRLGYYRQTDLEATMPIPEYAELGVTLCLAVNIAPSYGIEPIQALIVQATNFYAALAKQSLEYFESDMTQLPMSDLGPLSSSGYPFNGI